LADEELVADMIYNFVLPEVEKHNMRKKIRDQQQNYMWNAFISIYEKILELPLVESSQDTNQKVYAKNEDIQVTYVAEDTVKIDDLPAYMHALAHTHTHISHHYFSYKNINFSRSKILNQKK